MNQRTRRLLERTLIVGLTKPWLLIDKAGLPIAVETVGEDCPFVFAVNPPLLF